MLSMQASLCFSFYVFSMFFKYFFLLSCKSFIIFPWRITRWEASFSLGLRGVRHQSLKVSSGCELSAILEFLRSSQNPWKSRTIFSHHGLFTPFMMTRRYLASFLLIIVACSTIKADEHNHIVSRIYSCVWGEMIENGGFPWPVGVIFLYFKQRSQ